MKKKEVNQSGSCCSARKQNTNKNAYHISIELSATTWALFAGRGLDTIFIRIQSMPNCPVKFLFFFFYFPNKRDQCARARAHEEVHSLKYSKEKGKFRPPFFLFVVVVVVELQNWMNKENMCAQKVFSTL